MSMVLQFRTIRNSTVAINDRWLLLKPELLWLLICKYVCMYITAFTSISRTAFEIEALSSVFRSQWFAVNRFRKKTKEHSAQIIWDVENFKPRRNPVSYRKSPFLQAKSMNASEGKNFPSIEAIRSLRIFQAVPGTVLAKFVLSQTLLHLFNW